MGLTREYRLNHRNHQGFTLIEALVTISVLALVTGLALPSLRSFMVSNKMANLSNEFSSALLQTRALAVSKNACATICASKDIAVTTGGGSGTCSNAADDDFQNGWLVFVNKACNDTLTSPPTGSITVLRRGEANSGYSVKPAASSPSMVMFDPRGFANLSTAGSFAINPPATADAKYKRVICLDAAGRASVRTSCS